MEWTKIKVKHFLYTDYTLKQSGGLAVLLCLTAHLERMPSRAEMLKHIHYKTLTSLQQKLKERPIDAQQTSNDGSIELQAVLNKVLEDVEGIEHKKAVSRATSDRYREKQQKLEIPSDTSLDTTEKRREEKRREEKNIIVFKKPLLEEVKAYCKERKSEIDPFRFYNHYETNGWVQGAKGKPVKNWKACVRTWEGNKANFAKLAQSAMKK